MRALSYSGRGVCRGLPPRSVSILSAFRWRFVCRLSPGQARQAGDKIIYTFLQNIEIKYLQIRPDIL